MQIRGIATSVFLDPQTDYFYVDVDEAKTLRITLTDNSRHPIHLRNITRKQVYGLIAQLNATLQAMDEGELVKVLTPEPPEIPAKPYSSPDVEELLKQLKEAVAK